MVVTKHRFVNLLNADIGFKGVSSTLILHAIAMLINTIKYRIQSAVEINLFLLFLCCNLYPHVPHKSALAFLLWASLPNWLPAHVGITISSEMHPVVALATYIIYASAFAFLESCLSNWTFSCCAVVMLLQSAWDICAV